MSSPGSASREFGCFVDMDDNDLVFDKIITSKFSTECFDLFQLFSISF